MADIRHKFIPDAELHDPKGFGTASNKTVLTKDENGVSRYVAATVLEKALNFVDGNAAPPTEVLGAVYVLIDEGNGAVDSGWDGASYDDWVRFNGTTWVAYTPTDGTLCFDDTLDKYKVYDGGWDLLVSGIPGYTTAQIAALTPSDGDFVYDTTLKSLQRYNGSTWVSVANGYGLISVNDSSGVPTFYSDLQTAINATADVDTVYIHSDIQITSATTVTIPSRTSLTINLQGHRIWGDTTSGDFTIFTMSSSLNKRALYFTGGGIIETIGTASNVINAAPFIFLNVGSGELKCYFGNTRIQSQNANAFYTNGFKLFNGGVIYSENNSAIVNGSSMVIENVFFDLYETPTLGKTLNNCRMKTRYGGYLFDQSNTVTNCHLYGTVTKSGNYGLPYIHQGTNFVNNTIIADSSSTRPALFVRGSSGSNGNISNNKVINLGSDSAGYWVYGNGYNNYCYAANNNAIYVGSNCKKFIGNIAITNSTSHQAMVCYSTLIQDNSATNLDATNTLEALLVGRTSATTSEITGNKSYVENAAAYNMKLTSTGTLYYANNVMGLTGLGLDTNGNTNAMVNIIDVYGNIKLG